MPCAPSRSAPSASAAPRPSPRACGTSTRRLPGGCTSIRSSTSEARAAEEPDPLAEREHELDRPFRRLPAVHSEVGPLQALDVRVRLLVEAQPVQRRRAAEREQAALAQHPRDLRHEQVRIGEGRRTPVGHDDVEGVVLERDRLGARVQQRELEPGRLVRRARPLEPRLRVVEPDRAGAGAVRASATTRRRRSPARARPSPRRRRAPAAPLPESATAPRPGRAR